MGDKLVHPELKRGHSNWPEASHNVLIRFRSKDIFLERLHYHLSTDLGLLQANMSNAWSKKGHDYHWKKDLFQRLGLPVYHGVEEALKSYGEKREKELNIKKTKEMKRKRIARKIARKEDQIIRQRWSNAHGRDTYGDKDLETKKCVASEIDTHKKNTSVDTKPDKHCNWCHSNTHSRKTSKDCPYNNRNKRLPNTPKVVSTDDLPRRTSHLEKAMCLVRVL